MSEQSDSVHKTCLFINRCSPYGNSHAQEALDMAYALSAFEHKVSLLFIDDGVLQIKRDHNPSELGIKNFSPAFGAWQDYEIEHIYVEQQTLENSGLKKEDLLVEAEVINTKKIGQIMQQYNFIFND